MNQLFTVTVENVSPTGAAVTIKFMVMVTAAINSGSLWRDFPKTINTGHNPKLCLRAWNRRFDDGNRCAARSANTSAAQYSTPATQRRGIDGSLKLEARAAVEKACRGFSETTAPLRRSATATAAAVDILSGARKCNVANNTCPRRPYAPRKNLHEEMTAALTAANASNGRLKAVRRGPQTGSCLVVCKPAVAARRMCYLLLAQSLRRYWAAGEGTCDLQHALKFTVPHTTQRSP
jgi:hypothetical protein